MAANRQQHYLNNQANRHYRARELSRVAGDQDEDDDDKEDDDDDDDYQRPGQRPFNPNQSVDRIRRSFMAHQGSSSTGANTNNKMAPQAAPMSRFKSSARAGGPNNNPLAARQPAGAAAAPGDTIQVTLDEGYFARERRVLRDSLANLRTKLNSLQPFNPAKNSAMKQQMEDQWAEKEKYTLDSLNEIKGPLDERFQWHQPEDGREVWPSKLQYFLAITSYSIGLGNVIRFPILVQKNGGLAFILPFVIMLLLEGIPLLYLELAIGQRMRKAAISCWNLVSPFAAGIGLASAAVSFVIGLYYNTMVAWTLVYLSSSVVSGLGQDPSRALPFAECPDSSELSLDWRQALPANTTSDNYDKLAKSNSSGQQAAQIGPAQECQITGPFEYFWYRRTLDITANVDDWSHFNWPVLFWLTVAWLISYACLVRGLSSSKRIVFVASTFPYVILVIFFFKILSLDGMSDGVYYLFAPQWSKLFDPYVWLQAAAQVFFSLGLGFGGLIALSSYNPVNNNCYKDAVRVSVVNFCTSMFAGIVIFAILGYKANLGHSKCQLEREQQIEFYLADYNLKVLDYGQVFKQVPRARLEPGSADEQSSGTKISEFIVSNRSSEPTGAGSSVADSGGVMDDKQQERADEYDYDSAEAIASINNLDRQLDLGSPNGSFDYGDSDTEFVLNASNLISGRELDKIIENIPNLLECSIEKELDAATQGNGLVFVVLAEALSQFENNDKTWAIVFFLMILALGFDSQFGNLEGLLSSLMDLNLWPGGGGGGGSANGSHPNANQQQANSGASRQLITGIICLLSLIISIIFFAHGAGSYMFAIFDEYAASFSLVLIALFELLAISYIYGLKRFCDDCELMTGRRPHFIILLSWRYVSPILLLIVTLATMRQFSQEINYEAWTEPVGHLVSKPWPSWCIVLGAIMIICCVIWIPLVAILRIFKINLISEQQLISCWFPAEELREFHDIQEEHRSSKLERILFGFHDDD